jgi:hypothetical protein
VTSKTRAESGFKGQAVSRHPRHPLSLLTGATLLLSSCKSPPAQDAQPPLPEVRVSPREIAGVRLVPVRPSLLARCRQEAHRVPFPVPCPRILPARQLDLLWCNGCPPGEETFNVDGLFRGPVGYEGRGHGGSRDLHLVIGAFRAEENPVRSLCPGAHLAGASRVRGRAGHWILCPMPPEPGFHSGHVVLTWVEDGARYVVSLHGQTKVNRRIARVIAGDLVMVA